VSDRCLQPAYFVVKDESHWRQVSQRFTDAEALVQRRGYRGFSEEIPQQPGQPDFPKQAE
jgi:hypothetical protein